MEVAQSVGVRCYIDSAGNQICEPVYSTESNIVVNKSSSGAIWVHNTAEPEVIQVKELPEHPFLVGNFILVGLLLAMSFVSWAKGDALKRNQRWHNEMSSLFLTFAVIAAVPLIAEGVINFLEVVFGYR